MRPAISAIGRRRGTSTPRALGPRDARVVVDRLARFVRIVRDWSVCPISCFPGGCRHICRHECFALAIVAASQNHDLDCLSAAMRHLLDPDGHEEAMLPALAYAEAMRDSEHDADAGAARRDRRDRRPAAQRMRSTESCLQRRAIARSNKERHMRAIRHLPSFAAALALSGAAFVSRWSRTRAPTTPEPAAILDDLRRHRARDVLGRARRRRKDLQAAVDAFLADPTDATLAAASDAWKAARVPYMQTEGFRFGNAIVDDWEGRVNSWPLDEGLIDYVDTDLYGDASDENPLYTANVIANPRLRIGAEMVDASKITPELLSGTLQEALGVEANVATGYHAIEFLLWGQDLHGTGPGAGERPGDRLFRDRLHARELRPPRRLSEGRDRASRLRS